MLADKRCKHQVLSSSESAVTVLPQHPDYGNGVLIHSANQNGTVLFVVLHLTMQGENKQGEQQAIRVTTSKIQRVNNLKESRKG